MPASIKHLTDKKLNLTSLLARWKDGLYYTAAIVKCDKVNKRCLVCFEDGSEIWVDNKDVHIQLSLDQLNEDEDIVCCICDDGRSEAPNEIILCDVCQQGYHQRCHNPPVDSSTIDESEDSSEHKDWFCTTCSYILNQSNRAKLSAKAQHLQPNQNSSTSMSSSSQQQQKSQPQQKISPSELPQQQKSSSPKQPQQQSTQISNSQPIVPVSAPVVSPKQPVKVKQQPSPSASQQPNQKSTVGPIKPIVSPVQKPAPYYPLSNQVRVVATSSTAALASLTTSSALVVGSSAGRTKQDLVNQSNRSSQRQRAPGNTVEIIASPAAVAAQQPPLPPVKHAVRKSSVNFVMPPVRQSALPTATRSALPITAPPAKLPHLVAAPTQTPVSVTQSQPSASGPNKNYSNNNVSNNNNKSSDATRVIPIIPTSQQQAVLVSKLVTWTAEAQSTSTPRTITALTPRLAPTTTMAAAATLAGVGKSSDITSGTSVPSNSNNSSTSVSSGTNNTSANLLTPSATDVSGSKSNGAKQPRPNVVMNIGSAKIGQS